jgi:hypothetical protein
MSTLFDQPPRQESLVRCMIWIRMIARDVGFNPDKMQAEDWHALCDLVRTALAIQSADAFDEQIAGFGLILRDDLAGGLNAIADAIKESSE